MKLLIKILLLMGFLLGANSIYAQGGLLKKLKDKANRKAKEIKEDAKREIKNEARSALDQQLEEMRSGYDSTNFSYAIAFSDNAGLFEYDERSKKHQKILVGMTDVSGVTKDQRTDPLKRAKNLNEAGQFSYANNKFKRAEFFFLLSQTEYESRNSTRNIYYPKVIANLGLLYHTMGVYDEALKYSQEALQLRQVQSGTQSSAYASSVNNLAMLRKSLGEYNEAEKGLNQALNIITQVEGKNSVAYAILLNNKGMLFHEIGRYEQAETLLKEALKVAENSLREKSNNYQRLLVNLALLYQDQKRYEEAEKIYLEAIELKEKRLGNRNHPDLAHMLNLLASLYVEMGKDAQVEDLLNESLRIYEKKFGTEHPSYATSASNLGNFYRAKGKASQAEPLLAQSLEIRESTLGNKHPDYNKAQEDLALVYWQQNKIDKASDLYKQVLKRSQEFIRSYFPPMSEAEKGKYWDQLRPTFLRFYSFASDHHQTHPELLALMYQAHLNTKAILLSSVNKIKNSIKNSSDAGLKSDYQTWVKQKELLSNYYSYSKEEIAEEGINLDSLERAANGLEKSISNRVPELFSQNLSYSDIVAQLTADESALDVISFPHFDKVFSDNQHYAFLLADKEHPQSPKIKVIENGQDLEGKFLKYYRNMIKGKRDDKYSYANFWAPVEEILGSQKRLFISLDGVYNQISLNTLKSAEGQYLLEKRNLVFLTNMRDLKNFKQKQNLGNRDSNKMVVLVGNPSFGNSGKISPLPGTKVEVENIDKIMSSKGYAVTTFTQSKALEEVIKKIRKPGILHFATHGFFMSDPVNTGDNKVFGVQIEKAKENPMLKSGLMLTNAESALEENTIETQSHNNGVLTSHEISMMDLENNDMVLMSACETGLGDIKSGEGVYGLQRAFQIAGAETIVMSMWTVSDQATQELMTLFYKYYNPSEGAIVAFKKAQLELKSKFPEPYFWGAFIMIKA